MQDDPTMNTRRNLLRACVGVPLAVATGCAAAAATSPTSTPRQDMGGPLPMPADRRIPVAVLLSRDAEVLCTVAESSAPLKVSGDPPRCPVCEAELRRASLASAPTGRLAGRTYHFCSLGCKQRFDRSSEKFAEE